MQTEVKGLGYTSGILRRLGFDQTASEGTEDAEYLRAC